MILKIVGRNCGDGIVFGLQNNFAGKLAGHEDPYHREKPLHGKLSQPVATAFL
jgi:hypothetical protein